MGRKSGSCSSGCAGLAGVSALCGQHYLPKRGRKAASVVAAFPKSANVSSEPEAIVRDLQSGLFSTLSHKCTDCVMAFLKLSHGARHNWMCAVAGS